MRVDQIHAHQGIEWIVDTGAARLVAEMRNGAVAKTQFSEWPSGDLINTAAPLAGISGQFDACLADLAPTAK